ncbi:glycosyl transferase group 1 [Chthoniobacter flavus Ellin428]|uniref:Glycosyl transferase group 1 n=1 Tax=Chthoniobacter flavus Ellin428 TaxID=497964 RepID=B4D1J2_9BACT|nr:glycosyltransferase [Chthoniobacter flavus]EDY19604.1 glycosyl transferase group 1 [Chthoniobacter flavus Ellin428]TCO92844.1 glycosyl transferase family 1 [Chthoniobacter flavus]
MPSLDLARWAIVGVKDETGVGRMAEDLRRSLDPIRQLVAPSYRGNTNHAAGSDCPLALESDETLRQQLAAFQGIIIFEDTDWSRQAVRVAHAAGVKTVHVVLWEWLRFYVPEWQLCDLFVCVHGMAEKTLRKLGFRRLARLVWPLDLSQLPQREIRGPAREFAHNAGLLEKEDRKGTAITLEAFRSVPLPDIQLVIRTQNAFALPCDDPRVRIESQHVEHHGDLYRQGDVAVQPSKCEGLGFMILEAIASGLPVVTTDYPPMNEYVSSSHLLAATRWGKSPAEQTSYIHQAHFKIPKVSSLARCIQWCATHDLEPISARNRLWAKETFHPEKVRREWIVALERLLS